jgi:hypothetical protein
MRFKFNDDIIQTNKAGHTGSNGWWRLVSQASFDGVVIKAVSLTGKPRSSILSLQNETLIKLREKYGSSLEQWWREIFGNGLAELTESEANYLIRAESFESIRNNLIEAAKQGQ